MAKRNFLDLSDNTVNFLPCGICLFHSQYAIFDTCLIGDGLKFLYTFYGNAGKFVIPHPIFFTLQVPYAKMYLLLNTLLLPSLSLSVQF